GHQAGLACLQRLGAVGPAVGLERHLARRRHAATGPEPFASSHYDRVAVGRRIGGPCLLGVCDPAKPGPRRALRPRFRSGLLARRPSVRDLLAALWGGGRRRSLPLRRHRLGHPDWLCDLAAAARRPLHGGHPRPSDGGALHLLPRAAAWAAARSIGGERTIVGARGTDPGTLPR